MRLNIAATEVPGQAANIVTSELSRGGGQRSVEIEGFSSCDVAGARRMMVQGNGGCSDCDGTDDEEQGEVGGR
ncbi:hypothetical protein RRG08_044803 [Elysia crispata]|uniref:Uncharacterized protein n=1 Tax=Elysia crispata TaxID=231223 RepID=A0AAE1DP45_9GAST|nr:hypothetical protein RRG08_044803 [Elysia crispata]